MARGRAGTLVTMIPSAKRLIGSLRDIGYDFVAAVADLVDNSIAAGAGRVAIDLTFAGLSSSVRITDDGCGMNSSAVTEAMRYGADRVYDEYDLGKFGLGLKTASMSQCRKLTVATRATKEQRRIEVRCLDLDHIEETDRWEVSDLKSSDCGEHLVSPLEDATGTVVLWEGLDRVFNYKIPDGERARNGMRGLAERLDQHLGMVFHRFLSGEARRRRKLKITVNGTVVEPWDPFALDEKETKTLKARELELETSVGSGIVGFRPYVLPPQEAFSSRAAFDRTAGPDRWNRQQGFYIYREDRMIRSGGWCNMRTADEHTKTARAALEFGRKLDSAFAINVAKMRVNLPPELREQLEQPVAELIRVAQAVYRKGGGDEPPKGGKRTHLGGSGGSSGSGGLSGPSSHRFRHALQAAAAAVSEKAALEKIGRQLRKDSPEVAHELGY
jgi:hypothetical protein